MKEAAKGNIYKTFFLFGLPMVLSGLLSMTFSTVDTVIVGRFLGTKALAALGATSPLITFVSSVFWGYNVGFSIYLAKLFGAREYEKLKSVFYTNLVFSFCLSVAICGSLLIFHEPIFDFIKVDESLRKMAFEYFAVYVGGLFFITSSITGSYTVNVFGFRGYPLLMSLISAVINLIGNILSAIVFKWGVLGIAGFSVFAALVVDVAYFGKIRSCFRWLGVGRKKAEIRFVHIKDTLPYALPNTVQQIIMYMSSMLVSPLVNGLGVAASASYSVVSNVHNIVKHVYQHSARYLSVYSAQCVGEKKYGEIKRGVWAGFLQGVAFSLPFMISCIVFAEPICNLFVKDGSDLATREYSYLFAKRYLPFALFDLICNLFHALYKGVKAPMHLIGGTLVSATSRIGFSYLFIKKGIKGFYSAWILSWVIEAVFVVVAYFIGLWRPDRKKEKEENVATA